MKDGIANEFYEVRLRKGRLHVRDWQNCIDLPNANAFVSEGDRGDEYTADILPGGVAAPARVKLLKAWGNPVSATLAYLSIYQVPAGLNAKRSRRARNAEATVAIVTEVTLWAGVPRVDFRVTIDNLGEDHRLRALFPLPFAVDTAWTENQFHVTERSVEPQPWNGASPELPVATFPQKTFVAFEGDGMGLAVFNKGMQEGEVVKRRKGRQAYALTLLRCVGWLSRPDLVSRRGGAGPTIATPDSQMPGVHTFEYALTTYRGSWREVGVQPLAHSFSCPSAAWVTNEHEGSQRGALELARIEPASVVPSALHRSDADGSPVVRVYNSATSVVTAELSVPAAADHADLVDLLERPTGELASADGTWRFDLKPWRIASVRLGRG